MTAGSHVEMWAWEDRWQLLVGFWGGAASWSLPRGQCGRRDPEVKECQTSDCSEGKGGRGECGKGGRGGGGEAESGGVEEIF